MTETEPSSLHFRTGIAAVITHGGSSILLGPSLVHAADRILEALQEGSNPMTVLDADLADPSANHSVAVIGMAPAATSFVLRGDQFELRIETPSGTVETFPELSRGWRGGAVTSLSGWRIRVKSSTESSLLGDRTKFSLIAGSAPCSEAWYGDVDEFSFVDVGTNTTFTEQPSDDVDKAEPQHEVAQADEPSEQVPFDPADDETIPDAPVSRQEAPPSQQPPTPPQQQQQPPMAPSAGQMPLAPPHPYGTPEGSTGQVPSPHQGASAGQPPAPPSASYAGPGIPAVNQAPAGGEPQANGPRHAAPEKDWAPQLNSNQGHVLSLSSTVVVGRDPNPDRAPDPSRTQLLQLRSAQQELSRSHLVVSYEAGNVLVWDLDSANGTIIARGGTIPEPLQPMNAVTLGRGDIIDLGDGITLWLG